MSFCESFNNYVEEAGNCSTTTPPAICNLPGYLTFKEKLFKAKINPFMSQTMKEHILYTYDLLETNLKTDSSINYNGSWNSVNNCKLQDGRTIYDYGYKPSPSIPFLNGQLVKISPSFTKFTQCVPPFIQMFISADLFIVILFIIMIILIVIYLVGYDNIKNEFGKHII